MTVRRTLSVGRSFTLQDKFGGYQIAETYIAISIHTDLHRVNRINCCIRTLTTTGW
jgi:hypothetical protein